MMVEITLENDYEDNRLILESTEDEKVITVNIKVVTAEEDSMHHVDVNTEELRSALRKFSAK